MNLGMETEYVEHKRSTSELREGMESVASILNKHGHGTLYFGVRPSDGEVVGQDVSEKTLRDVSQAFTNRIEPRVYPTVERLVTDDGTLTNAAAVCFVPSRDVMLRMGVFADSKRVDILDNQQVTGTLFSMVDADEFYILNNIRRHPPITADKPPINPIGAD